MKQEEVINHLQTKVAEIFLKIKESVKCNLKEDGIEEIDDEVLNECVSLQFLRK